MSAEKVYLVGAGAGTRQGLTARAAEVIERADVFAGARRLMALLGDDPRPRCVTWKPGEVRDFLQQTPGWKTACILLSGDIGFYSGAAGMLEALGGYDAELVPGISSVQLLCARLGIPWDSMRILSLHGRRENIIAAVNAQRYTFALLGGWMQLGEIAEKLRWYGMEDVKIHVGQRLGYADEKIFHLHPSDLPADNPETLVCAVFENPSACGRPQLPSDEEYIRGKVPMTKSEVRTVSIQKMQVPERAVVYDIGAGTGSVSIQTALMYPDAAVYAVERNEEALDLIERNKQKFRTDNVTVIPGRAPACLEDLPAPDCIFVGGSGGSLAEILQAVRRRNPRARIVMNFVTLETITQAFQILHDCGADDAQWVQMSVTGSRVLGHYHLMTAQNPVMIVTVPGQSL
ncbi:MAG: precorrin-6y C5,15-methyltransferase (decarboxylating) subunit CbiE [Lachnospiraceae bacterium]|jgi:precorrin-6Y C5,15-methyltransferase (decarboxylating)